MPINITMPALSPTMEEGNLAKWLVKEGDKVKSGDVIAEIETDKATMEVEAVDEGKIGKIVVAEGTDNVKVNAVIAVLLTEGENADDVKSAAPGPAAKAPEPPKAPATAGALPRENTATNADKPAPAATGTAAIPATAPKPAASAVNGAARVFASPLARRLAKEANIDVSAITGSGPHGRVVKSDVEAVKSGKSQLRAPAATPTGTASTGLPLGMTKQQVMALYPEGSYDVVPNDGMRKTVAARLTESKQTVPHFYLTLDCRIDAMLEAREKINAAAPLNPDALRYVNRLSDWLFVAARAMNQSASGDVLWVPGASR